uniref:Uncharacterized protein n=1 Tax=Arundo donax TaxID=35708 RepID=A0A0A9HI34_ARUDO
MRFRCTWTWRMEQSSSRQSSRCCCVM